MESSSIDSNLNKNPNMGGTGGWDKTPIIILVGGAAPKGKSQKRAVWEETPYYQPICIPFMDAGGNVDKCNPAVRYLREAYSPVSDFLYMETWWHFIYPDIMISYGGIEGNIYN